MRLPLPSPLPNPILDVYFSVRNQRVQRNLSKANRLSQLRIIRTKTQGDQQTARQLCEDGGQPFTETATPSGSTFPMTFIAFEDSDTPIATCTVSGGNEARATSEHCEHFHLDDFASVFSDDAIALVDSIVLPEGDLQSTVALRLLGTVVDHVNREPDIHFLFLSCSSSTIPLYEKAGCRQFASFYKMNGDSDTRVPLCLVISDHQHLTEIGSPLLRIVQKYGRGDSPETRSYFQERWMGRKDSTAHDSTDRAATEIATAETGSSSPEEELSDTEGRLQDTTLFEGIDYGVVGDFLESCAKEKFGQGEKVIEVGAPGQDLFMFILGYAEVIIDSGGQPKTVGTHGPGDVIGELNMLLHTGRTAQVVATTDVEVIRIPESIFREGIEGDHRLSARLNFNLARILADRLVRREREQS